MTSLGVHRICTFLVSFAVLSQRLNIKIKKIRKTYKLFKILKEKTRKSCFTLSSINKYKMFLLCSVIQ